VLIIAQKYKNLHHEASINRIEALEYAKTNKKFVAKMKWYYLLALNKEIKIKN